MKVLLPPHTFTNAIRRVEDSRGFLSTLVGVNTLPPKILTAEKTQGLAAQTSRLCKIEVHWRSRSKRTRVVGERVPSCSK